MFARSVSIRLKPNGIAEFCRVVEKVTIPLLQTQKGFQDVIAFFVPGGDEAFEISLWDQEVDAEAGGRKGSSKLRKALENVMQGDPEVRIYAVSNSTFHKIAAPALA